MNQNNIMVQSSSDSVGGFSFGSHGNDDPMASNVHKDVYGNALSDFDVWEFESPVPDAMFWTRSFRTEEPAKKDKKKKSKDKKGKKKKKKRRKSGSSIQPSPILEILPEAPIEEEEEEEQQQQQAETAEDTFPQLAPLINVAPERGVRRTNSEDSILSNAVFAQDKDKADTNERLDVLVRELRIDQVLLNARQQPRKGGTENDSTSKKASSVAALRSEGAKNGAKPRTPRKSLTRTSSEKFAASRRTSSRHVRQMRAAEQKSALSSFLTDTDDGGYERSVRTVRSNPIPESHTSSRIRPRRMKKSQLLASRPGVGIEKHLRSTNGRLDKHFHSSTSVIGGKAAYGDSHENRSIVSAPPAAFRDHTIAAKCRKLKMTF